MNMTDVFNATGRFFQWTFKFMHGLGNIPNLFFWLVIAGLVITWLSMQAKYNKEANEKGNLK